MTPRRDAFLVSKSLLLVVFFLLASATPLVPPAEEPARLGDAVSPAMTSLHTATDGFGHDFGGTNIVHDGLDDANVRMESLLEGFERTVRPALDGEQPGTPDLTVTRYGTQHWCWTTAEGTVRTAIIGHTGVANGNGSLVDNVAATNLTDLVDCAIAVTPNELQRVLYADGSDLKMGRYALESQTYWDGPRWHTRTIFEDVNATNLALSIHPDGVEWGLMRDDQGALHQVNFTGTYWLSSVLDAGPVGHDFELEMDANGVAHILYTLPARGEVILLRVDGEDLDRRVLSSDMTTVDAVGMDLDRSNIEQVATAQQGSTSFSIDLIRSLAGQDTGRIDPTPSAVLDAGLEDALEGAVALGDLNHDGLDDVVVATPTASSQGHSENGRLDVFYGGPDGVSTSPDVTLEGTHDGAHLGSAMALGDVNGDGHTDLALGVAGFRPSNASLDDGKVQIHLGGINGLSVAPAFTVSGHNGERLGSLAVMLERTGQANVLAVGAANHSIVVDASTTHVGKVNLYASNETGLVPLRNLTQSTVAEAMFGRSMAACDINGDGLDDLIVGNTGTYADAATYSSVEYFTATSTGYDGTPAHRVESNIQNRLFGHNVACLGDVHDDGFEDHIITEPFNGTTAFAGGKLWLFNGTDGSMTSEPDWTYAPAQANARIGEAIVAAGDVNEDGYNDVLISTVGGNAAGALHLYLGSSTGLQADAQLVAQGETGDRLASRIAALGDLNGDGLGEVVYSLRTDPSNAQNDHDMVFEVLSERDWESISFVLNGDLEHLELGTAGRGETSLLYAHNEDGEHHLTKLEHMNDGTPAGRWVSTVLDTSSVATPGLSFAVGPAGRPYAVTNNGTSVLAYTSIDAYTAVEQTMVDQGTMGQHLGSTLDNNGHQWLAYTSGGGHQLYFTEETSSSWNTGLVRQSATLTGPVEVLANATNVPHLLYRYGTGQLELAINDGAWTLHPLGGADQVLSEDHPVQLLDNGSLVVAVAAQDANGTSTDVQLWTYNGTNISVSTVASNVAVANLRIGLTTAANGSLMVCTASANGQVQLYVQNGTEGWFSNPVALVNGFSGRHHLVCQPNAIAVANPSNAVYLSLEDNSTNWTQMPRPPAAHADGPFDFHPGDGWLVTGDPQTQELRHHRLSNHGFWVTAPLTGVVATGNTGAHVNDEGVIHMAYWDATEDDVEVLRFYPDADRDLVFDEVDALALLADQWSNGDGDHYGDNPDGPMADACPSVSGTSAHIEAGCPDIDTDGWSNSLDACTDDGGTSWIDRYGCEDRDQDGWSDNLGSYLNGDVFYSNWKQALDTDGDGFGDNHGPDCCATVLEPSGASTLPDVFPYLASQYQDSDGDGFGDNDLDAEFGDLCPYIYGLSHLDRNGCVDTDGDGASDPSNASQPPYYDWTVEEHGADLWPLDGTQWMDTDGDGYGDNGSLNATNPDQFPFLEAVATDNDLDGFPDEWTDLYNGTNNNGLLLDGCLDEWGNSTSPVPGCLDSDGDGFRDVYTYDTDGTTGLRTNQQGDAFPSDSTQWSDEDGDGFGDQLDGENGDRCPQEPGVLNGTAPNGASSGIGCRQIDVADEDGDGVINELDTCPLTPPAASVNEVGCADAQLDDDEDGVSNAADVCPNSGASASVDDQGCTEEQRNIDTDGDGINDPNDTCPGTASGSTVDASGCAEDQRDTDGDGVNDADDACVNTSASLVAFVDATGCVDESALEVDVDGDGYAGPHRYDIDPDTGLYLNQTGDAFPSDATQWLDTDGDGYGDNPDGNNADECPEEAGTSFRDFLGCEDDGDGWRDQYEDEALRNDATQWRDTDFDGYGDNWGNAAWNTSRTAYYERLNANGGNLADPGQFILGATNADLCPNTPNALRAEVDEDGCHPSERDSDEDGVVDLYDACPTEARGPDGFNDGCPPASDDEDDSGGLLSGAAGQAVMYGGAGLGVLVVLGVLLRLVRSDEDDDEDDDDFFDDEDDEDDDVFAKLDTKPARSRPNRAQPQGRQRAGPTSGPSQRSKPSSSGPSRGPPGRAPSGGASSGPARGSGPPGRAAPKPAAKVAKKKSVTTQEASGTKVRKAKIQVDMSIFEPWQADDREAAVEWVVGALADGEDERTMLMQLQETGWSAEQSRAICDLARNR